MPRMAMNYILDDDNVPVPVDDLVAWATWMDENGPPKGRCQLAELTKDGVQVSTVFLGHPGDGLYRPTPFETMVFGGPHDLSGRRYYTYQDALIGHGKVCRQVFGGEVN